MAHLSFILPLAARETVSDWSMTSALCGLTVRSCLAQMRGDVSVELCCHDVPASLIDNRDPRLFIHRAPFPPPTRESFASGGMTDKWKKVAMGLVAARGRGSSWLMIVDADDFVSSRLSDFLSGENSAHGFAIKTGYQYRIGSRMIHLDTSFNCGTNSIIRSGCVYLPQSLEEHEIQKCIMLRAGHTVIEDAMEGQSTPLTRLPFPGAVYVQHASQHSVAVYGQGRALWKRTLREHLGALRRLRLASRVLPRGFGVPMADIARFSKSSRDKTS